jgi:hypothetical protein
VWNASARCLTLAQELTQLQTEVVQLHNVLQLLAHVLHGTSGCRQLSCCLCHAWCDQDLVGTQEHGLHAHQLRTRGG